MATLAVFRPAISQAEPRLISPKTGLSAQNLAVIVNTSDPESVEIGSYYQLKRQIPVENIIRISFPPGEKTMSRSQFNQLKTAVDNQTPARIQAYALTWTEPYRVDCMSVTAAFAFGFDIRHCASGCHPTQTNPYFDSLTSDPHTQFGMRPTMALAGENLNEVKRLIDRGVAADGTHPKGTVYLLDTHDTARNVRSSEYPQIIEKTGQMLNISHIHADHIDHRQDILMYFTGLTSVSRLKENAFLPGAIADHLTSLGGLLTDSSQMSALRWLEAGATGSYGTVVEPCNFLAKFPHPGVIIIHYTGGDTLIEAYWKSVLMPGQGIFIGEPLAKPY